MKHLPKLEHVFFLWAVAISGLLLAMSGRLGSVYQENLQLRAQNTRLVNELVAEQGRANYWMEYRSVDAEDGWAAYEQCEADSLAQLEDDHACPNPNDLCGMQLDICYSYCVEGRPTVQVEHAMCKAWWTGFLQRESSWGDLRKAIELP